MSAGIAVLKYDRKDALPDQCALHAPPLRSSRSSPPKRAASTGSRRPSIGKPFHQTCRAPAGCGGVVLEEVVSEGRAVEMVGAVQENILADGGVCVGQWVLPGRQNSVRRGRKPRGKTKIDQTSGV